MTKEELLAAFQGGKIPRASQWQQLISKLYDTANEVETVAGQVAKAETIQVNVIDREKNVAALEQGAQDLYDIIAELTKEVETSEAVSLEAARSSSENQKQTESQLKKATEEAQRSVSGAEESINAKRGAEYALGETKKARDQAVGITTNHEGSFEPEAFKYAIAKEDGQADPRWIKLVEDYAVLAKNNLDRMSESLLTFDQIKELNSDIEAIEALVEELRKKQPDGRDSQIRNDLKGEHAPGSAYVFPLANQVETSLLAHSSLYEAIAEVNRGLGQSGVYNSRQYEYGGTHAYHRPFDVGYATINLHSHQNYDRMCGLAEFSVMLNGYYLRTRHNDYRLRKPRAVGETKFLRTEDIPAPAIPPSVLEKPTIDEQIAEMREYFRAYAARDTSIRDYRPYFQYTLAYLEMWFENFSNDLDEPFESFRHANDAATIREALNKAMYYSYGGHKNIRENIPWHTTLVKYVDSRGRPQTANLKYRIVCMPVGDAGSIHPDDILEQVKDHKTKARYNYNSFEEMKTSRRVRYKFKTRRDGSPEGQWNQPDIMDEIMAKIPGLDGDGAVLTETYTQYGASETLSQYGDFEKNLNAAYYNRFYSMLSGDASNRRNARRGFNDPTLFVAKTSRPEVVSLDNGTDKLRFSYALPLEFLLRTPLEHWNPFNLAITDEYWPKFMGMYGEGKTQETALPSANKGHFFSLTPEAFFSGDPVSGDPADTYQRVKWIKDSSGTARPVRDSGMYPQLPSISGIQYASGSMAGSGDITRVRFPVYPVYHEGSYAFAEVEALRKELDIL